MPSTQHAGVIQVVYHFSQLVLVAESIGRTLIDYSEIHESVLINHVSILIDPFGT